MKTHLSPRDLALTLAVVAIWGFIIGSGVRDSKLLAPSEVLAALPGTEVLTITKTG